MIFPAALPLAIGSAAIKLLGMITRRLEKLLAEATAAITHQAAPASDSAAHHENTGLLQSELVMIFQAQLVRCIVTTDRSGCDE